MLLPSPLLLLLLLLPPKMGSNGEAPPGGGCFWRDWILGSVEVSSSRAGRTMLRAHSAKSSGLMLPLEPVWWKWDAGGAEAALLLTLSWLTSEFTSLSTEMR